MDKPEEEWIRIEDNHEPIISKREFAIVQRLLGMDTRTSPNEDLKFPDMVCAHRTTKFYLEEGAYKTISGGYDIWPGPSCLNKLTGGAGAVFPPHVLYKDIVNSDIFMKICTTNDDIWFWLMAVLNGTKICVVPDRSNRNLIYVRGTQEGPCLSRQNDGGEKLFWKDFNRMLAYYPQIDKILRAEYQRRHYD